MIGRLWYPQLDVMDAVRRMSILLQIFESPPGIERLYISDFYLANPPLLYKTKMDRESREAFNQLKVARPEKTFLTYPSAQILFQKMDSVQRSAVEAMVGKGLLSVEEYLRGRVELTTIGSTLLPLQKICEDSEFQIGKFVSRIFAGKEEVGNVQLRRKSGLRRLN
jgi:hypothetical protein